MKPPKLFVGQHGTHALTVLRLAAAEGGWCQPFWPRRKYERRQHGRVVDRLEAAGWVEYRRAGPRGGRRVCITETGRSILKAAEDMGPDVATIIRMLST